MANGCKHPVVDTSSGNVVCDSCGKTLSVSTPPDIEAKKERTDGAGLSALAAECERLKAENIRLNGLLVVHKLRAGDAAELRSTAEDAVVADLVLRSENLTLKEHIREILIKLEK